MQKIFYRNVRSFAPLKELNKFSFYNMLFIPITVNFMKFDPARIKKCMIYYAAIYTEDILCLDFKLNEYRSIRPIYSPNHFFKLRKDSERLNLKHIFNRPASKTWDLEEFRESEWPFVKDSIFFSTIEEIWEFDHGMAENSWNIIMYKKPVDHWYEFFGSDEDEFDELVEPLLKENDARMNFFTYQINLLEEF